MAQQHQQSSQASAVDILLTKIMQDKYCAFEKRDLNACISYYVPAHIDNSYVDLSLQRRGAKKCEEHSKALQQCMQDEKKQTAIMRAASKHQKCGDERNTLLKCQQAAGGNKGACEPQFYGLLECGMINIITAMRGKQAGEKVPTTSATSGAAH